MQPRNRFARPNARRIGTSKLLGDPAQNRMIVARTVLRHVAPVHCLGGEVRISVASHYVAIPSFRIRVSLLHESHSTKAVHQSSGEILIRQIAFESHTLLTIRIEQEHSRRPDRGKAVEPGRVLLDVSFDGKEVLVNELGRLLIGIRLGIQPSTSSSSRSRAEIEQDRTGLLLRRGQALIDVLTPIHAHVRLLDSHQLEFQLKGSAFEHKPATLSEESPLRSGLPLQRSAPTVSASISGVLLYLATSLLKLKSVAAVPVMSRAPRLKVRSSMAH